MSVRQEGVTRTSKGGKSGVGKCKEKKKKKKGKGRK